MKYLLIKFKKRPIFIVDMPEDNNCMVFEKTDEMKQYLSGIDNKSFNFICKGKDLTEEIAQTITDKRPALKSVIDVITGIGWNWLENPVRNFSPYDPRSKTGWHEWSEEEEVKKNWQEEEDKTFKNPSIFEICENSMTNIKEWKEKNSAWFLINLHTIGQLRDETDLDNAKFHSLQTINFIEDLLKNIEGTVEEKLQFILKTKEEIPKFHGKKEKVKKKHKNNGKI